jgi:hypothetical protein
MKNFVLLALLGVGAVAVWKHHLQAAKLTVAGAGGDLPSGVSMYPAIAAPSKPDQILAAQITNSDAVSDIGFSPAFGADENQPGMGEELI